MVLIGYHERMIMGKIQKRWKVGDSVVTGFSGQSTTHTVSDVQDSDSCGSGQLVKTDPPVPPRLGGWNADWLDAGWFWRNNA